MELLLKVNSKLPGKQIKAIVPRINSYYIPINTNYNYYNYYIKYQLMSSVHHQCKQLLENWGQRRYSE